MDEVVILSDAAAARFKMMYGEPGKKGKMKSVEKSKLEDSLDDFKKLGQFEEAR